MMKYIKNNNYYSFDFELDSKYNIGENYEDNLQGKYVKLSNEQVSFKELYPTANAKEVWDIKLNPIPTVTIEQIRANKIAEIQSYDISNNVNEFIYNNNKLWFDSALRGKILQGLFAEQRTGNDQQLTKLVDPTSSITIEMKVIDAIDLLDSIELYAKKCFNITTQHINYIKELNNIDEIKSFDITLDYPDKLVFNTRSA